MKPYLTVLRDAQAEQTIERSRFIGRICHVKTAAECEDFFRVVRKAHRNASHNVSAYVLGDAAQLQWAGDDGEPRGSSGAPIVHMLAEEGISDTAVVVTRYFGGVKLGKGGLVRAYTGTAKLALEAAGLGRVSEKLVVDAEMDYADFNRLESAVSGAFVIEHTVFGALVTVSLACDTDKKTAAMEQLLTTVHRARVVSERIERVTAPVS